MALVTTRHIASALSNLEKLLRDRTDHVKISEMMTLSHKSQPGEIRKCVFGQLVSTHVDK